MRRLLLTATILSTIASSASAADEMVTGSASVYCSTFSGAEDILKAYSKENMKVLGCNSAPKGLTVEPLQTLSGITIALFAPPGQPKQRVYFAFGLETKR